MQIKKDFKSTDLKSFFYTKKPNRFVRLLVGVAGFEPAASCSQSRRDNRATLHPESGCKYNTIYCLCKGFQKRIE